MSRYKDVKVAESLGNSFCAMFVAAEKTLNLYVDGVELLEEELNVLKQRQQLRLGDIRHSLVEQQVKNEHRRKTLMDSLDNKNPPAKTSRQKATKQSA